MEKTISAEMEVEVAAVAEEKTLIGLPEVVFRTGLFPLLDNNQLLRLRRVNKGFKEITDRYLRSHAPSKKKIILVLSKTSGKSSLSQFLQEDRNSSAAQMPSTGVELRYFDINDEWGNEDFDEETWLRQLQTPEMDDFLLKYGNQIRFLTIKQLTLPMERDSAQFRLLERIPKLQKLHIVQLKSRLSSEVEVHIDTATDMAGDELPNCFKTTLKLLEVDRFGVHDNDDIDATGKSRLWKLVVQLKKLETFRHPWSFYETGERFCTISTRRWGSLLENLNKIVKSKTTAIHTLDFSFSFSNLALNYNEELTFTPEFISLCVSNKIKCTHIHADFLSKMERSQVAEFINCVTSMNYFHCNYDSGDLVFSNLVKLSLDFYPFYYIYPGSLTTLQKRFSTARFPALRVLELLGRLDYSSLNNRVLGAVWKTFVNIEELVIYYSGNQLGNEAFFGSDVSAQPAFLQLTKLKKFSLEIPYQQDLTDAVFCHVFRQMKLKEFYLKSNEPIEWISKYAIWSLLTGPFFESIEKFPFRDWSLSDTSAEEFLELSRKFPNNQPL